MFRIELADGTCAFRGEGSVESFRHTPGGEQLGLTLRMRRLDRSSKELHAAAFTGITESAPPAPAPALSTAGMTALVAAIGAAAEQAMDALAQPPSTVDTPVVLRDGAVVSRTEGQAAGRIRDDLRPAARPAAEPAPEPVETSGFTGVESESIEQTQAVGRMAVARMSVDEYEARKAATSRAAAPPPIASLEASSESTAAWSEADDALDFEGLGSDIRENVPAQEPVAPPVVIRDEEPIRPAPTLPPLEGIVVARPEDAVGIGVTLDEVTFSGASAYEMPKSAPIEAAQDLDLDFDFTAVAFTASEATASGRSGNRSSVPIAAAPAVGIPSAVQPVVHPAAPPMQRPEYPVAAAPVAAPAAASVPQPQATPAPAAIAAGPSRLPPPPPPRGGASAPTTGAPGSRPAVPMSKPIPKPTAGESEEKPGLFGWLRGKK